MSDAPFRDAAPAPSPLQRVPPAPRPIPASARPIFPAWKGEEIYRLAFGVVMAAMLLAIAARVRGVREDVAIAWDQRAVLSDDGREIVVLHHPTIPRRSAPFLA